MALLGATKLLKNDDQCILCYCYFSEVLTYSLLLRQTSEFSMKSVNLCKFMAHSLDVLTDKLHPRFLWKIVNKRVGLIFRC